MACEGLSKINFAGARVAVGVERASSTVYSSLPTEYNCTDCESHHLAKSQNKGRKTYVLDTSVLLADPAALRRFAEHEVIIPITVIGELESKRDHPELGYFARAALRALDDLRISHGRLDEAIEINEIGGTVKVELNHSDPSSLPTRSEETRLNSSH